MAKDQKNKTPTFMYSLQAQLTRGQTPRDVESVWMKSDALGSRRGDSENEIEMQARETGSQSL